MLKFVLLSTCIFSVFSSNFNPHDNRSNVDTKRYVVNNRGVYRVYECLFNLSKSHTTTGNVKEENGNHISPNSIQNPNRDINVGDGKVGEFDDLDEKQNPYIIDRDGPGETWENWKRENERPWGKEGELGKLRSPNRLGGSFESYIPFFKGRGHDSAISGNSSVPSVSFPNSSGKKKNKNHSYHKKQADKNKMSDNSADYYSNPPTNGSIASTFSEENNSTPAVDPDLDCSLSPSATGEENPRNHPKIPVILSYSGSLYPIPLKVDPNSLPEVIRPDCASL